MEEFREILYKLIEEKGILSSNVLKVSIELDKLINEYYRKNKQCEQNKPLKSKVYFT